MHVGVYFPLGWELTVRNCGIIVHFLPLTVSGKFYIKTLSKFTSGYVYGKREWSRVLTGGQDPQEENDATYLEAECLLLSQTQWLLL